MVHLIIVCMYLYITCVHACRPKIHDLKLLHNNCQFSQNAKIGEVHCASQQLGLHNYATCAVLLYDDIHVQVAQQLVGN